jgi:hypothetical protein
VTLKDKNELINKNKELVKKNQELQNNYNILKELLSKENMEDMNQNNNNLGDSDINVSNKEDALLKEQIKELNKIINSLKNDNSKYISKIEKMKQVLNKDQSTIDNLNKKYQEVLDKNNNLEDKLLQEQSKNNELIKQRSLESNKSIKDNEEIEYLKNQLEEVSKEKEKLMKTISELENNNQYEKYLEEIKLKNDTIELLKNEINSMKINLNNESFQSDENHYKEIISEYENKIKFLTEKLKFEKEKEIFEINNFHLYYPKTLQINQENESLSNETKKEINMKIISYIQQLEAKDDEISRLQQQIKKLKNQTSNFDTKNSQKIEKPKNKSSSVDLKKKIKKLDLENLAKPFYENRKNSREYESPKSPNILEKGLPHTNSDQRRDPDLDENLQENSNNWSYVNEISNESYKKNNAFEIDKELNNNVEIKKRNINLKASLNKIIEKSQSTESENNNKQKAIFNKN